MPEITEDQIMSLVAFRDQCGAIIDSLIEGATLGETKQTLIDYVFSWKEGDPAPSWMQFYKHHYLKQHGVIADLSDWERNQVIQYAKEFQRRHMEGKPVHNWTLEKLVPIVRRLVNAAKLPGTHTDTGRAFLRDMGEPDPYVVPCTACKNLGCPTCQPLEDAIGTTTTCPECRRPTTILHGRYTSHTDEPAPNGIECRMAGEKVEVV